MNFMDEGLTSVFAILVDDDGALYVSCNPVFEKRMSDLEAKKLKKNQDQIIEIITEAMNRGNEEGLDD